MKLFVLKITLNIFSNIISVGFYVTFNVEYDVRNVLVIPLRYRYFNPQ